MLLNQPCLPDLDAARTAGPVLKREYMKGPRFCNVRELRLFATGQFFRCPRQIVTDPLQLVIRDLQPALEPLD
jgi:hypothetical protein